VSVETAGYDRFEREIVAWARQHPDVIGLVATGAGARRSREPDEWSDHDLWIIARPGSAAGLRDGSWVPEPERVVLRYRESPHGTNVIYEDGHLIEFAAFELEELSLARVNDYRVLFGDDELEMRLDKMTASTGVATQESAANDGLFGRFVGRLAIGISRFGRGEYLSAGVTVRSGALDALARMITEFAPPQGSASLDNLDPFRRFELAYPQLGARLDDVLILPLLEAASTMLDIADQELGERVPGFSHEAIIAVRRLIGRASGADQL
jgi:hypothetical protein